MIGTPSPYFSKIRIQIAKIYVFYMNRYSTKECAEKNLREANQEKTQKLKLIKE
jgi:hypothetical protein